MIKHDNLFVTGGAGTWGYALARRRKQEGWTGKLTVYSTDSHKHEKMRREFPDINFVQGDIRNPETLYNAMVGHDIVIHMAAVKIIPVSEVFCLDTFDVNVNGSQSVCSAAINAHIKHVVGISTDKAAHPVNTYGATKMIMERMFQEYARMDSGTYFHLLRAGNVLESNGSVIEVWKKAIAADAPIKITNPEMTRFWMSPDQAVSCIIEALKVLSGAVLIPKLPSLSIGELADIVAGKDWKREIVNIRPGEKIHETLITAEESGYAAQLETGDESQYFLIYPNTFPPRENEPPWSYSSDRAEKLDKEGLLALLI